MKKVCTAMVLLTALILGACAGIKPASTRSEKQAAPDLDLIQPDDPGGNNTAPVEKVADNTQETSRSVHSRPSDLPHGIKSRPIAYDLVSDPLPDEVASIIKEHSERAGYFARSIDGQWYVTILMGEQNTDGYDIDVTVVEGMDEETLIRVEEIHPSEDEMVLMAPTYPYRVIRIEDDCITEFKVINQNGDIYPIITE